MGDTCCHENKLYHSCGFCHLECIYLLIYLFIYLVSKFRARFEILLDEISLKNASSANYEAVLKEYKQTSQTVSTDLKKTMNLIKYFRKVQF